LAATGDLRPVESSGYREHFISFRLCGAESEAAASDILKRFSEPFVSTTRAALDLALAAGELELLTFFEASF
jgi:hypothetical protein